MFRMQPQKHVGTLIWLHGIADPINRYKNLFEMWQNGVGDHRANQSRLSFSPSTLSAAERHTYMLYT